MNTSQKNNFLSEVLNGDRIPLGTLSYFRERFRDRLYDLVLDEFFKQEEETGLTRADVARRIGRRPEQITRWFGAPGNWTLETVSDLLLAIAKSEPGMWLLPLEGRSVRNFREHTAPAEQSNQVSSPPPANSAIEANSPYLMPITRARLEDANQQLQTDTLHRHFDRRPTRGDG